MNRAPVRNHVEEVMGTVVSFVVPMGDMPERRVANALKDACRVLHEADEVFSTWNPGQPDEPGATRRARRSPTHLRS